MASAAESGVDGPVMTMMNKRLRALRKKYNRILQMEESLAQGKTLNKEQEEVFRSKPAVAALIDEYERLRQPLSAALEEESALARLSSQSIEKQEQTHEEKVPDHHETAIQDLINLLYFGCLFDAKSQSEFASIMFTRTHERESCLTYDYVTDDSTGFLLEGDLDLLSSLSSLVISRPANSEDSHKSALLGCVQRAKLWLSNSDKTISPDSSITYAGLRERLNRILSSEYFTKAPEMKAPADVAVAVGKYQAQMSNSASITSSVVIDVPPVTYQQKEDSPETCEGTEAGHDQSDPIVDSSKNASDFSIPNSSEQQYQNENLNEQQYGQRRSYQNHRGRGRRDFVNGRGRSGRSSRGGGSGYQNDRGQYYDSSYYPGSYYNPRGRGRRGGGDPMMHGHDAAADFDLHGST